MQRRYILIIRKYLFECILHNFIILKFFKFERHWLYWHGSVSLWDHFFLSPIGYQNQNHLQHVKLNFLYQLDFILDNYNSIFNSKTILSSWLNFLLDGNISSSKSNKILIFWLEFREFCTLGNYCFKLQRPVANSNRSLWNKISIISSNCFLICDIQTCYFGLLNIL